MCDYCNEYREQLVILRAVMNFQTTDIAHEEATTLSIPEEIALDKEREERERAKKEARKHMQEYRNYFNCQKAMGHK